MFNSKKDNCSHHFDSTLCMVNGSCNKIPKAPLNPQHGHLVRRSSVLLSPTKSNSLSPRRYSLSEINPPTNKSSLKKSGAHSPGPLLASLSFKDNVSMYEETKSSGLARRIVLYNEEAEQNRQTTHQEKYRSPGLFPVVHLFKKKSPHLEQPPKKVKIKLSNSDYLRTYIPQYKSTHINELAKPRLQNHHNLTSFRQKRNDTNTKSVLDALKEISRKRIHSNEECDLNEDPGKRIRTQLHNGCTTSSKRNRADSPRLNLSESPSPKQTQKKLCVYDEFAASKSSTDFSFLNKMELGSSKRKSISTSTESLKETKHVKLTNAETQTIISSPENKSKLVDYVTEDSDVKSIVSPLKVFDDAPLDRIRKNRLAALMGNLAGKDAAILPNAASKDAVPKETKEFEKKESIETCKQSEPILAPLTLTPTNENRNESDLATKALISILSPNKTSKELSPVTSDKHVHFILPVTPISSTNNHTLPISSTSVDTPIISAFINNPLVSSNLVNTPVAAVELGLKSINALNSPSQLFGNLGSSRSDTQKVGALDTSEIATPLQIPKPDLFTIPTSEGPKISSPQKLGGFKFDLKVPTTATVSESAINTLTVSSSSASNTSTASTSLSKVNSTTFTFDKPSLPKNDSTFSFGASANTTSSSAICKPTFSGGEISKSQILNKGNTETKLPSANFTPSVEFSFGSPEITSSHGITTTNIGFPTLSSFVPSNYGSQNTDRGSSHLNVGSDNFAATTSTIQPTHNFGINSAAPLPVFGKSDGMAGFTSIFVPVAITTTSGYESVSVSSFGSTLATSTSTPIFGKTSNASKSVFNTTTPVTSTPVFDNIIAPTSVYGINAVTSPSVFGTSNVSVLSGTGIGATTKTSSVFESNNLTFVSNLTPSTAIFGSSSTKTPAFGSPNFFGPTKTQAQTFGSNTSSGFVNSLHTKSGFGPSNSFSGTSTTTTAPTFGISNANTTFSFGSSKPTTNVFELATTTSSNTFSSNNRFDSSSGFGNTTLAFGTTNSPAFGQVENKPTFAFGGSNENKSNSVFGSGADNLAFGKPSNTQGGLGNSTKEIGSGNSTSGFNSQTNGGFNFGPNAASSSQAPFNFSHPTNSAEPPKQSFNFTGGTLNPPAFGSNSSTLPFGSLNSSFGTPTFGAAGPSPTGVFNIGAGSNIGRPRTQLRAKRRT